jgi:hypothetical protein
MRIKAAFKKTSFLLNPENFKRVRNVFLADQDFYAVANLTDERFWKEVGNFAEKRSASVTDIYVSCIPSKAGLCPKQTEANLTRYLEKVPGQKKYLYESTCGSKQPKYIVKEVVSQDQSGR